jgi:hypothetical protein
MNQLPENKLYKHLKSQYNSNAVSLVYQHHDRVHLKNILPIDTHQANAVLFAINQPVSLIYGPPGTGKTNTLVNLVAELIASDKQLLILTKKQEPAKIIQEKLAKLGLGDVILDLSQHDISTKNLLNKLKIQFDKNYSNFSKKNDAFIINEELLSLNNQLSYYEIRSKDTSLTVEQMINEVAEFTAGFNQQNIQISIAPLTDVKESITRLEQLFSSFPIGLKHETDKLLKNCDANTLANQNLLLNSLNTLHDVGGLLTDVLPELTKAFSFHQLNKLYKLYTTIGLAKNDATINWGSLFEKQKLIYAIFNSQKHINTIEAHWKKLVSNSFWHINLDLINTYFSANKIGQIFQFDNKKALQQHLKVPLATISPQHAIELIKALEQHQYLSVQKSSKEKLIGFSLSNLNIGYVISLLDELQHISTDQLAAFKLEANLLSKTSFGMIFSKLNDCPSVITKSFNPITIKRFLSYVKPVLTSTVQIQKYKQKRNVVSNISTSPFENYTTILEQFYDKSETTKLLKLIKYQHALRTIQTQYQLDFELIAQKQTLLSKKSELEEEKQLIAEQSLCAQYSGLSAKLTTQENLNLRKLLSEKKTDISSVEILSLLSTHIKKLCPITLITPESLKHLKLTQHQFDFLIIDEASQLHLPEVLPAMERCHQMTLFGDDKQMPPATFFKADASNTENSESMLSICYRYAAPSVMLKNHYRSQHKDLITFSNNTFYQSQLITKQIKPNELEGTIINNHNGSYLPKPDATNIDEAKHLVRRLSEIAHRYNSMTVAIVTSNTAQMALIQEQLRLTRKNDTILDSWLKQVELKAPLIIGNLDNIQGKERELVLVSFVYGWQKTNKLKQQFGLFSQYGGERRLNVLLTRASKRLEWFCNFSASDLKITSSTPLGVKTLKDFLFEYETNQISHQNKKANPVVQLAQPVALVKNMHRLS